MLKNIGDVQNEMNGAYDILRKVGCVVEKIKNIDAIPSIFLIGEKGTGITSFSKAYEKILFENRVYKVRSDKTFLELIFPSNGSENDYRRFFQSPKVVASMQNEYHGVFAISFQEWKGKELISNAYFRTLLNFIDENRKNIYFVFHVKPDFEAVDELRNKLGDHVNLLTATIGYPQLLNITNYVIEYLEKVGIKFSTNGKLELCNYIGRELEADHIFFDGHKSLDLFAQKIQFEIYALNILKKRKSISEEIIMEIEEYIEFPRNVKKDNRQIGFKM